jgi:hypothetical protein
MKKTFGLLLMTWSVMAVVSRAQAEPAVQYRELLKSYDMVSRAFRAEGTDQERQATVERMDKFPEKFLELAETYPRDPVALSALRQAVQVVISVDSAANHSWEVNREAFPRGSQGGASLRIVEVLLRDHLQNQGLAPICDRMRWGARPEFEKFLSAALEQNPHRNVQGMACLALAQLKHTHLRMLDLAEDQPDLIARYERIFGNSFVEQLQRTDRATRVRDIESLYERAATFNEVINIPFSQTVAERAKSELYELRHLSPGKTAPEIIGRDQHGLPLKLSDHRGQVVLLYFWSEY